MFGDNRKWTISCPVSLKGGGNNIAKNWVDNNLSYSQITCDLRAASSLVLGLAGFLIVFSKFNSSVLVDP